MTDAKTTTIWKFPLTLADRQTIKIPRTAVLLHLGMHQAAAGEEIALWMAVAPETPKVDVEIICAGTGHPLPHVGTFLGTVFDGPFVWHFFTSPHHEINRQIGFHYITKGN